MSTENKCMYLGAMHRKLLKKVISNLQTYYKLKNIDSIAKTEIMEREITKKEIVTREIAKWEITETEIVET
jgi:hypothetical protein